MLRIYILLATTLFQANQIVFGSNAFQFRQAKCVLRQQKSCTLKFPGFNGNSLEAYSYLPQIHFVLNGSGKYKLPMKHTQRRETSVKKKMEMQEIFGLSIV